MSLNYTRYVAGDGPLLCLCSGSLNPSIRMHLCQNAMSIPVAEAGELLFRGPQFWGGLLHPRFAIKTLAFSFTPGEDLSRTHIVFPGWESPLA
jgi:hypothetical protein